MDGRCFISFDSIGILTAFFPLRRSPAPEATGHLSAVSSLDGCEGVNELPLPSRPRILTVEPDHGAIHADVEHDSLQS